MPYKSLTIILISALLLFLAATSVYCCGDPLTETCSLWCSSGEDKEASAGQETILTCEAGMIQFCGQNDESILRYTWYQKEGPEVEISNSDSKDASFTPTQTGKYVFYCMVTHPVTKSNPEEKTHPCGDVEVSVD